MKVLHVADAIDPSLGGGTAERTFQLALALHRAGVACTILCTDIGLGEKRKAELKDIDLVSVSVLFRRFVIPKISWRRIKTLVAEADIVHVTGHWSILGALACLAAQRLDKPYVYCPAGSLRIFGRSGFLKRLYNRLIGFRIVRAATCCLAVTELERAQFHEYGVSDAQITLFPNGVHPDPAMVPAPQNFRSRLNLEGKQIILFMGRLSPIKGPDLLLEAFARIAPLKDSLRLVFAGPDGELGQELRTIAEQAGLIGHVLFTGFLAGQDKQDALAAADLLVVPSRQEAMSLVALEAGLCGTPVLLTNQCGFDEVQSAGGGLVVAVDVQALADGMQEMLQDPEGLLIKGERLNKLVLSRYTWDGLTRHAIELYANLICEIRR